MRGSVVLPAGTGKTVRVAVFAPGRQGERGARPPAPTSSAWTISRPQIKAGNMDFDVVIATPDAMRVVGQLGQILGPRGLMPNPKVGTVTPDVAAAVKNAKAGQVQYRADKAGIVQCTIGRASFTPEQLREQHARADRGAEQGEARRHQRHLSEEAVGLEHDGRGVRVDQQAWHAGVTADIQMQRTVFECEKRWTDAG